MTLPIYLEGDPQIVEAVELESHRREITALFCDLRGFTGFTESADAEDVMALLRDYHATIGEIIIKYNGTLERYAGDGVMVVFNDPVPVENPALQAVLMALEVRDFWSFKPGPGGPGIRREIFTSPRLIRSPAR